MRAIGSLAPSGAASPVVIEIIGHQWWWEVRYPAGQAATANEIHLPVGQPISLQLSSVDVIHSFWVPELHGKLDLVPGHTNSLVLQADQPAYRGQAPSLRAQHDKMALLVVAQPPTNLRWLADAGAARRRTDGERTLWAADVCNRIAGCHAIRERQPRAGRAQTYQHGQPLDVAAASCPYPEHLARE